MGKRLFGRDPALWAALTASLISVLGSFVVHLSPDQEGALNGIVAAGLGITVWGLTKDGGPALILGFIKALVVVAAAWHFHMPTDRQTVLMTVLSAAVAMFVRTQVGAPVPPPAATASPVVVVDKPTT
jgi:uncharacterized membrane protein YccC